MDTLQRASSSVIRVAARRLLQCNPTRRLHAFCLNFVSRPSSSDRFPAQPLLDDLSTTAFHISNSATPSTTSNSSHRRTRVASMAHHAVAHINVTNFRGSHHSNAHGISSSHHEAICRRYMNTDAITGHVIDSSSANSSIFVKAGSSNASNTSERGISTVTSSVVHPSIGSIHGLSEDQLQFRALAEEFAKREFLPYAARWDAEKFFPVEALRNAANLGFAGLFCREDVGGTGVSRADAAIIFESLAFADVSTTAYLTIHNMNCSILDRFGSEEQRHTWLPPLITMDLFSSYCLTEPDSGSDAASLKTTASKASGADEYILNGSKAFISGGGASDIYLVMARTGGAGPSGISCFLLEKGMKGLSFGKLEKKLGWNSQPTSAVIMEDVRVPKRNLVGGEGNGFRIAMTGLDGGRVNIAACSVGGAQFCLQDAMHYVLERKQFGRRIADFQNTQFKLADMATAVESSRLMVRSAALAVDQKSPTATMACAMAKRHATDACYDVANQALQLYGGYGYLNDYSVERYLRDLRVHTILEGTNEIMRLIISRQLFK